VSDVWEQELAKAFAELNSQIEKLAQDRAGTEAVLYAKDRSDEWKQLARFEYELSYEIRFLRQIRDALDARIVERQRLVDEQVGKRAREREERGAD
jgi:hypothetical protein